MELRPQEHDRFKCQWFTPQDDPRDDKFFKCGQPAKHEVKVHGGVTKAFVFLCDEHKRMVNEEFAKTRTSKAVPRKRPAAQTNPVKDEQRLWAQRNRAV